MLFDLRGSGRRRTVKIVYVTLAFLMGGGLVLFGIGGDVSGGLVDAITERTGGGGGADRFEQQEKQALARVTRNPNDAEGYAQLARARFQLAGQGDNYDPQTNTFTTKGRAVLGRASAAWEKHLRLTGNGTPNERVARLMVQAYSPDGLNDPAKAADAQEAVAEANPTSSNVFAQLAVLAYAADQTRKGDLAKRKAIELADKQDRAALRSQLDAAKSQSGAGAGATQSPSGG